MISTYIQIFFITILCNFIVCFLSKKVGLIDRPDGLRKVHKGDISLGGGLSLYIGITVIFLLFPGLINGSSTTEIIFIIWYVSSLILLLGVLDDFRPLPVSIRLIFQILACWLVIIFTDVYLRDLGNLFGLSNIYLNELGIPLTIFMVVGMCNAFNMLDGMDGLVGFVSFSICLALSFLAFITNLDNIFLVGSLCLLSFIFFNLGFFGVKWKIFLGDSGATWLGFIFGWLLVILSQGETKLFTPVVAIWLVVLPLIDALSTFLHRLWNRKPIFSGDRTHIHHLLLDSGMKKWKVLLSFLLISILTCSFAIYSVIERVQDHLLFYGFLTLWFVYFLITKFPYIANSNK